MIWILFQQMAQAQNVAKFLPHDAQVITAFTPFEILQKEHSSIVNQPFVNDAILRLHEFFLSRIPLDSLKKLWIETPIKIGLDNTSPWYLCSQRMPDGITHYALIVPTFKTPDWLRFMRENMSLGTGNNVQIYENKYFYNIINDMLITWNKEHLSIQKFVLPNAKDYKPTIGQQHTYIVENLLPKLLQQGKNIPEILPQTAQKYKQLTLLLKYKSNYLNIGFDINEATQKVKAYCSQNHSNVFLKMYAKTPNKKIYFFGKGDMALFKIYPPLAQLKDKTIVIEVQDDKNFTLEMELSKNEVLSLINAFYNMY